MSFSNNVIVQNATNLQCQAFVVKMPDHILASKMVARSGMELRLLCRMVYSFPISICYPGNSKEETGVQTPVGTRCGISASDLSSQPASAIMNPFGLDDNVATEMSDEHIYDDWQHTPCAVQNPIMEESSALVHGRYIPCIDRLPQADVTGTPQVEDDRARSEHVIVYVYIASFLSF